MTATFALHSYAIAKAARDRLAGEHDVAALALKALPGVGCGPMGLTPDAIKFGVEYRGLKRTLDLTFERLRNFNRAFTKRFKKDIRAERGARPYRRAS